jgi:hypothetical protein
MRARRWLICGENTETPSCIIQKKPPDSDPRGLHRGSILATYETSNSGPMRRWNLLLPTRIHRMNWRKRILSRPLLIADQETAHCRPD